MHIVVPIKLVPDLAEELDVDASGAALDSEWLRFKANEFDDHALEEALQLKDEVGGTVTAMALDAEDVDKSLYAAAAKGADRLIKITGDVGDSSHGAARAFADAIKGLEADLVLTGVQAVDDRDGQNAVLIGRYLDIPHVSVVTGVSVTGSAALVHKEYSGGVMGEFEVTLPAVLGIQAARETPRYAPVGKVRRAMRSSTIDEVAAGGSADSGSTVTRMFKPEKGQGAKMIAGSADAIAEELITIMRDGGVSV
jgi:electron transfer flavoprotein beta subunit